MSTSGWAPIKHSLALPALILGLLAFSTSPSEAQNEELVPMENFFDDDGVDPGPQKKPNKQPTKAEKTPSKPLPVPEPELPVDEAPAVAAPPDLLDLKDPEILSSVPDDDVEPFMQEEGESNNGEEQNIRNESPADVGEEFSPFDEDPDIVFGGGEEDPLDLEVPVGGGQADPTSDDEIEASQDGIGDETKTDLSIEDDGGQSSSLGLEDEIPETSSDAPESNDFNFGTTTRVKTGETIIKHPLAEKGLVRITKDKTYVYRVPKSLQDRAISFRAGIFEPTELANPDTGTTFQESYDQTRGPIVFFEYEWNWLRGSLGKIGIKLGSGVFTTQGNGQFRNNFDANGDRDTPKEQFTFIALPNTASLVYRFQYSDTQMMVPYVDGGLMGITFLEWRDDQDFPKTGVAPAGFFSGGLAFSLSAIDNLAILGLDREYGINNIFFMAEFRQIINIGSDYDFTAPALNGGFMFEF